MTRGYQRMSTRTETATGGIASWTYGACRVTVNLTEAVFTEIKIAAMRNNRSISAEINSRLVISPADQHREAAE